ncbi:MAG TPA: heavy-metal-associated domain-containing protein [Candidatus Kapabacteria bacterium]|nr:heavy-metal-associated domain-containing protein [Candidatus Kapabacteria bacterium]
MKYKLLSAAIAMAAVVFVIGCNSNQQGQAANSQAQPAAQPQTVKTVIDLPTMKCKNCAATITAAVQKLDGVQDVKVDVDTKKAEVQYVSTKLDEKKIEDAISNAGYDANSTKRNETAYGQLAPCCQ